MRDERRIIFAFAFLLAVPTITASSVAAPWLRQPELIDASAIFSQLPIPVA